MKRKPVVIGAVAYSAVTFPLAAVWHAVLFKSMYEEFGYFGGEPNFAAGFLSILVQGAVLSYGFGLVSLRGGPTIGGLKYALGAGALYWTCHVLAFAAKNPASNVALFYAVESAYLTLQFGIYGLIIGNVYRRFSKE